MPSKLPAWTLIERQYFGLASAALTATWSSMVM